MSDGDVPNIYFSVQPFCGKETAFEEKKDITLIKNATLDVCCLHIEDFLKLSRVGKDYKRRHRDHAPQAFVPHFASTFKLIKYNAIFIYMFLK